MLPVLQVLGIVMFSLGVFGIIYKRSFVEMLIGVELMLNGAGLNIMAAAQFTQASAPLGQLSALLVMGLAAAESTLVLAIVIIVRNRFGHVESDLVSDLKG